MAITRVTWTDDSGTGTDGTVLNNAELQAIYDSLDTEITGQVPFPATQVPSTDANTLDDYEEGSWTPTLGGTGGQSGQTYSIQVGRYVKIGKLVYASFHVALTAKGTITTAANIQGLPFTVENVSNAFPASAVWWNVMTSSYVSMMALCIANTTTASLYGLTAAATGMAGLVEGGFSNTSVLIGTLIYRASA